MNVLADTNFLLSDVFMKSSDFAILFSYLQATGSKLLVPQLVLEEASASYKRSAEKALRELEKKQAELRRLGMPTVPTPDLTAQCLLYEAHLSTLIANPQVELIPYQPDHLKEVMRRAINRIRPCSDDGEEIRDAVLWLSVLDQLRANNGSELALVTDDSIFLNKDRTGLHQTLRQEADGTGSILHHYPRLTDLISVRASAITGIDEAWVSSRLAEEDVKEKARSFLMDNALDNLEDECAHQLQLTDYELGIIGFSGSGSFNLETVKVYELKGDRLEVHSTFLLELEIETEVTEFVEVGRGSYTRFDRASKTRYEYVMPQFRVRLVSDRDGDTLINTRVVEWELA